MLFLVEFGVSFEGVFRTMVLNTVEAARAIIWDTCAGNPDHGFDFANIKSVQAGRPLDLHTHYTLSVPCPQRPNECDGCLDETQPLERDLSGKWCPDCYGDTTESLRSILGSVG